jgi:hypothetical protein
VLERVNPEQAAPLIARGARIDVWEAAHLGIRAKRSKSGAVTFDLLAMEDGHAPIQ